MEQQTTTELGPIRLYELAPAYQSGLDRLLALDLSTEEGRAEAEAVGAEIESLGLAIEAKVDGTAALIAAYESTATAIAVEITRLTDRRQALAGRAERLRAYVFEQLKRAGLAQVDGPRFTAAIRLNPEAVEIVDQAAVPSKYLKVEISQSIDKKGIHADHKAGAEIPGVRFTRRERLEIR